jgi:hypothetical protein
MNVVPGSFNGVRLFLDKPASRLTPFELVDAPGLSGDRAAQCWIFLLQRAQHLTLPYTCQCVIDVGIAMDFKASVRHPWPVNLEYSGDKATHPTQNFDT